MADSINRITAGDLFSFVVTPKDELGATYDLSVGTWTCTVGVFQADGTELISKSYDALTADNTGFITYLTNTLTAALPETIGNDYLILAAQSERTDVTPTISIERTQLLDVDRSYIG